MDKSVIIKKLLVLFIPAAIIRTGTDGHRLHVPLCIHKGYVLYTFQGQSR